MSDLPPSTSAPDPSQQWGPPPSAAPPIAPGRPARWPLLATLAIALIGVAVGIVGWFRPVPHNNQPPPKPAYTDQQVATAQAKLCGAFGKLDRAFEMAKTQAIGRDPL